MGRPISGPREVVFERSCSHRGLAVIGWPDGCILGMLSERRSLVLTFLVRRLGARKPVPSGIFSSLAASFESWGRRICSICPCHLALSS